MKVLRETTALLGRSLRHIQRSPDTIITVAVMPIAMLLLFVYVFGGAIAAGTGTGTGHYVDYLLPGILLIAVTTGISYTAVRVFTDVQQGFLARLHTLPVARAAVLWAHVVTSMVATGVSLAVIVAVAVVVGFRPHAGPTAWLAVVAVLGMVTLALTWLALIPGLTAKSIDGATAFAYPLIFLPFVSSAFVPTATMPGPVRFFAQHQPATAVVDALRALLAGRPAGDDVWVATAWCGAVTVIGYVVAMRAYRRTL